MTHASSMQFSPKLRVHNYLGCSNVHTSVVGKSRLCKDHVSLSSHSMRQDAWSLHLLSCSSGPIHPASSRCNVFLCQSVLVPGGGNDINVLKSAAAVLTKSYNALRGNPVVLHLIPAAGIIAFTAWGLLPLIRLGRVIILNRTDSSWKKSKTHYVLSTYIQPLLLWFGATLICRALDPVILPTEASQAVKQRVLNFIRSLSTVLAFAYCLSSLIQEVQKFYVETQNSNSSETRNMGFDFAGKAIYTAVWVAAVSLFMELLGFSTQKWLTAGGLGTVLLTLAGREIFTNFLSSVMIQATRPFVLNEWIQTKIDGYEVSGTVEHVGWWSPTIIRGDDREAVHIPNHKFTVNVVRNLSQKTHWRIKTHLAISHLDAHKINNIVADMRKVLAKNPQVEQQKLHRRVFLDNVNPENQALMILISCFVKTSHFEEYLCVKEAVILDLLRIISHHRARLATPIRTVQKFYREPDLENIPFSDTIFSRSTAPTATNSSLLLIEPSYKISADDKVKSSTRPVKDTKTEGSLTPDSEADSESGTVAALDPKENKVKSTSSTANTSTKATVNGNEQQQNVKIVDAIKKAGAVNPEDKSRVAAAAAAAVEKSPVTNSDTNLEKTDNPSVISQTKQDMDRSFASQDKNQVAAADEKYPVPNSDLSPEKTDNPSAVSQTKQEMDRSVTSQSTGRSSLEENIVLGVALEGSRRTLPIEEETIPTITAESKGLAASRNGNNGSPAAGKETKDGNQSD